MSADRVDPLVAAAFAALRADPIPPLPLEAFLASLTLNAAVGVSPNINKPDPHSGMPGAPASLHGGRHSEETASTIERGTTDAQGSAT